jgi:hypothetical protein
LPIADIDIPVGPKTMKRQAIPVQTVLQFADRPLRHIAALHVTTVVDALAMTRPIRDHEAAIAACMPRIRPLPPKTSSQEKMLI